MDPQSGDVVLVVVELGMGSQQTLEHLRVGCEEDKNKTSILMTHRSDFPATVLPAVQQKVLPLTLLMNPSLNLLSCLKHF